MATIKDIAKKSGFSVSTVSYALSDDPKIPDKTKQIIKAVARELNYVPNVFARGLKNKGNKNIGVFLAGFKGPVHPAILSGIGNVIEQTNGEYKLIATTADENLKLIAIPEMSERATCTASGRLLAAEAELLPGLVVDNMALVRSLAIKFKDRGTEYEDLVQIGTIGMLKAIRSFDVERGTAFSTYAVPLIVGEIRKHLRDDGPIKVGREYKRMGAILLGERNRIIAQTGRDPSIGELARHCGVSVEDAAVAMDAVAPVSSLSETVYEDGLTLEGTLPDRDSADETERMLDRLALSQAIGQLDPLWRKIVLLRYWRNMTQQQVAMTLGLSQVKVSREEKKIMERLRELLGGA